MSTPSGRLRQIPRWGIRAAEFSWFGTHRVKRHRAEIYLLSMGGERDAGAPKLRLVTATEGWSPSDAPVPTGGRGLVGQVRRWLATGRWQAQLQCRRAGHLPARTATGTRCWRCGRHWDHS
jgi:hypothetical protein